jgi:hypothetical protein
MTSYEGLRSPFFSAGTALFKAGNTVAVSVKTRHQKETEANWRIVRVAGLGKAFKIDLEEVLVSADVMYQTIHSAFHTLAIV